MGNLILVRHGESQGNALRVFTTDPVGLALTELGRAQARAAAHKIRKRFTPTRVITSHYDRARHTGEIIAEELKLPVAVDLSLHERDMGRMRGRPYGAMTGDAGFDGERPWLWKPPGGESLVEVRERVGPVLDRLRRELPAEDLIVVSHGGVMVALWAHVTGAWEGVYVPPNCGIVVVPHQSGRYQRPQVIED